MPIHLFKFLPPIPLAAAVLLAAGAFAANDTIKNVRVLPLRSGINTVKGFLPNGGDAVILRVWRDNGNAHGYTKYMVMYQDKPNSWGLVDLGDKDTVDDVPHTGEDNVTSVRFARGEVDGAKASLLIIAERNLAGVLSYYDPAMTTIRYYRLIDASDVGPGTTPFVFRLLKTVSPKQLYCNSDMALNREAGLPLPETYDGTRTVDGC